MFRFLIRPIRPNFGLARPSPSKRRDALSAPNQWAFAKRKSINRLHDLRFGPNLVQPTQMGPRGDDLLALIIVFAMSMTAEAVRTMDCKGVV